MECAVVSLVCVLFIILAFAYCLFELHYFLRMLISYLHSKFLKKKLNVLGLSTYSSMCLPTDVDILLLHMNNARYLREVDFARVDFYVRTGLWHSIRQKGGLIFQAGTLVRYRRCTYLFSLYHITSQIVYWDKNSIYMEHKLITKSDNFVRAIVYGKQKIVKCDVHEIMIELMKNPDKKTTGNDIPPSSPQCPPEIQLWIEATQVSSDKLRENPI